MRLAKPRLLFALFAGLTVLSAASGASAQASSATTTVQMSTQISEPASIDVVQNLSFNILPQALTTGLVITSSAAGGLNANVVLRGAAGDTVSLSIPSIITVVRDGGIDTVTVRTVGPVGNVNLPGAGSVTGVAAGGLFSTPVTVIGNLDGGILSFTVGGQVMVANNLVPGEYRGVLTVIASYN